MAGTDIFKGLPIEVAMEGERLSRLVYELRENRRKLLGELDCTDEAELLDRIGRGRIAEHPGYEAYLAARILADTREAARDALAQILEEARRR